MTDDPPVSGDTVIAWTGHAGMPSIGHLRGDIDRAVAAMTSGRLVLDLAGVGFFEPVAVGVLVHARNLAHERGIDVVLRAMPTRAKRLLAMTGLTDLFVLDDPPPGVVTGENLPHHTSLPALPDDEFDDIAELVRQVLLVPTALVTLVDRTQQVFPGAVGLPQPWQDQRSTPLTHSFCQHVVDRASPLVIDDARKDPLLAGSPAITDLSVVAYAGMPLTDTDGRVVGALCAIDSKPRRWTADELDALRGLAATCSAALRLRTAERRAHG